MEQTVMNRLIEQAAEGDRDALEKVLSSVQDLVFNLSLRMLGMTADAEDASQEIFIRIMTHLSSFRGESSFSTWVYRLATNYLINYKKSLLSGQPLTFEIYGADIKNYGGDATWEAISREEEEKLAEELKYSCTNVMLQCMEPLDRCIFILGTMFKLNSAIAGEILDMTPENYRKKLSRLKKKVGGFLEQYCGLAGSDLCNCRKRVPYALSQQRISRGRQEYTNLKILEEKSLSEFKEAMEYLDDMSLIFEDLPFWKSTVQAKDFLQQLLKSSFIETIFQPVQKD